MDSPFAPKPIMPGLSLPRIERGSGDRRRKGQAFEDELAGEQGEPHHHAPPHPANPAPPPPTPEPNPPPAHRPAPPDSQVGVNLDLEA